MILRAPAKLNLALHVFSKRRDGYHNLETLLQRVRLFDTILIKSAPLEIRVRCIWDNRARIKTPLPQGQKNLAYHAAQCLSRVFKIKKGVTIAIRKRIPLAAGLGGGSSDAAAVLLGLNRLWKLNCSKKKLMALGASLGSDVPYFILETPFAVARGRGEKLKAVPVPRGFKLWHCVIKPPFGISTQEAYRRCRPSLTARMPDARILLGQIKSGQGREIFYNNLESVLGSRSAEIQRLKGLLIKEGASMALMSGSGSAVFGIFRSKAGAQRAAKALKSKNKIWQVFVASTC